MEVEVLQDRQAPPIGKAHLLELDRALHGLKRQSPLTTRNRNGGVEQLHHPVGGGHAPLVVVEGAAEGGERPEQALGDEHQKAVAAHGDHALPGLQSADHQDRQEGEEDREPDQGDEGGRDANGSAIAEPVGLTFFLQSLLFPGLGGIALDREHAPQVVGQQARHIAGLLSHLAVAGRQSVLELQGAPENHRNRQEGHPSNPWR